MLVAIATHKKTGKRCLTMEFTAKQLQERPDRALTYCDDMNKRCTSHHSFYLASGTWEEWLEKLR